jgi:hypothetical protein
MPPKPRRRLKTETDKEYTKRLKEWKASKPYNVEIKVQGNTITQKYYIKNLLPMYVDAIKSIRLINDKL